MRKRKQHYRGITTAITVLGMLIVAISMVALINTITMAVLERTREIGIPLGFGFARGLVALAQNVFNEHVLVRGSKSGSALTHPGSAGQVRLYPSSKRQSGGPLPRRTVAACGCPLVSSHLSSTRSPGWWRSMSVASSLGEETVSRSSAVIVSPPARPTEAAGVPRRTCSTGAPLPPAPLRGDSSGSPTDSPP